MQKRLLIGITFAAFLIINSITPIFAYIPPTNAYDQFNTTNATVQAQSYVSSLKVVGQNGITVTGNNQSQEVIIGSTVSQATGTYNTTQANNINENTGGYELNFINGTGATVNVLNSHSGKQANVTISATGTGGGCPSTCVTSISGTTGNITASASTGAVTLNTGNDIANILKSETITQPWTFNDPTIFLGNVGIGTLTPTQKLAVVGNQNLTGILSYYNGINTAGTGVAPIYATSYRTGITTNDASNISVYTIPSGSGQLYRICGSMLDTSYTSGEPTLTIYWTENGVQNNVSTNARSSNLLSGIPCQLINPDSATTIKTSLTGFGVATVNAFVTVEQMK